MDCGSFWIKIIFNLIIMLAEDVKDPEKSLTHWPFYNNLKFSDPS